MSSSARNKTDMYSNILTQNVTQSSANALEFAEIDVGLNLFDKVGLLVSRIEFYNNQAHNELVANGDTLRMAVTQSNQIASISPAERSVINMLEWNVIDHGTPANATITQEPWMQNFADLPGGGILVAPKPLYFAIDSDGFTAASVGSLRMYFTIIKLKDADYFELLESRRFFG